MLFLCLIPNISLSDSCKILRRWDDHLRSWHICMDNHTCHYGDQDLVGHISHILVDLYNYPHDGHFSDSCSIAMDWVGIAQPSPLYSLLLSSPVFWAGRMPVLIIFASFLVDTLFTSVTSCFLISFYLLSCT